MKGMIGMSTCKACGAEICWVRMESGKMMPCNLDGQVIDDKGEKLVILKPHWENCPKSQEFHRARAEAQKARWKYPTR